MMQGDWIVFHQPVFSRENKLEIHNDILAKELLGQLMLPS